MTLTFLVPVWLSVGALAALLGAWCLARAGADRWAVLLRLGILGALGLALARPVLARGFGVAALVLVERSEAVDGAVIEAALADLERAAQGLPILTFGTAEPSADLAAGLSLAARALPQGGRILVLASDADPGPEALTRADEARQMGLRVDVTALPSREVADAAVTALDVPEHWRAGEAVPVLVHYRATGRGSGRLVLRRDGEVQATVPITLGEAVGNLRLTVPAPSPGPLALEAQVYWAEDSRPGNDTLAALVWIHRPPRVLVLGDGQGAVLLADALASQGLPARVMAPERMAGRLSALHEWDVLALVDVPAAALGLDHQAAVSAFATELGGGVLLTGGRQSFLPGNWERTPLAAMAPVELEPPPREERDAVALVLMIDQSASMGSVDGALGLTRLALAREAAALAAEALHAGDHLAIIAYDDSARWLVPLGHVVGRSDPGAIDAALGQLDTGGGTRIHTALELGLPALAGLPVATRHAVLLTDGRDFSPDPDRYDGLLRAARESGVSLSTIALGADADHELLARLASLGRGRFHVAAEPGDLPRLAVQESETVRSRSTQEGRFRARRPDGRAQPVLAGLDLNALPELAGYLATTPRLGATVALEAPAGDPLLAIWQYGAGRVAAWLSDTGEDWALGWSFGAGAEFWARLVRYLAAAPTSEGLEVASEPIAGGLRVQVDAWDEAGESLDLADATLILTTTQGVQTVALPQRAPGRYAADLALAGPAALPAQVRVQVGERLREAKLGLVLPPPLPPPPRRGAAFLANLAEAGGGQVMTEMPHLERVGGGRWPLWPILVILAAVLWPLDVGRHMGLRFRWARTRRRVRADRPREELS